MDNGVFGDTGRAREPPLLCNWMHNQREYTQWDGTLSAAREDNGIAKSQPLTQTSLACSQKLLGCPPALVKIGGKGPFIAKKQITLAQFGIKDG